MATKLLRIRSDASAASRAARLAVAAASRARMAPASRAARVVAASEAAGLAAEAASLAARSATAAASHAARLCSRCCSLSIHYVPPRHRTSAFGEPYETDDFRGMDVTEDDVVSDEALDERWCQASFNIKRDRAEMIRQVETHSVETVVQRNNVPIQQSELSEFADGIEVQETDPSPASFEPY
ncbi:hypothetical protein EJB05_38960 [Eragrostis curvula]|uniref:Uncharacterized protein n=1 Tax=Eragrostis curvula TaxID=38414 RepID=A0A5J9TVP0_9POAL|nr:hypothetical protein EJB05_38960 [Eragrostis curvula]